MKKIIFIIIYVCIFLFGFTFANGITTLNYPLQDDTYTSSVLQTTNTGLQTAIAVGTSNRENRGYFEIDVSVHNSSNLLNVQLYIFSESWGIDANDPVDFYYCPNGFNETSLTWANQVSQTGSCNVFIERWSEVTPFTSVGVVKILNITNLAKSDVDGVFTIQVNITPIIPYLNTQLSIVSSDAILYAQYKPYINLTKYDCVQSWTEVENSCLSNNSKLIEYVSSVNCSETYNLPVDNNTYEFCLYCNDEWESVENLCLVNNTKLISYINTNNCSNTFNLPLDNNTYESCSYCNDTWELVDSECSINNTIFISYTETNNCSNDFNLPPDNNTYISCNYCTPELVQIIVDVCTFNGTAYTTKESYVDNNYDDCCLVTGLGSDCPTMFYPYNVNLETFCVNKTEDFELDLDENIYFAPFVEDKIWAKIWLNDTTQNYSCISYIKTLDGYNLNAKDIVQVNPDYNKKEKAIFSLTSNEYEVDEYFMTNRGIGTAYFTKENLLLDGRPYLFGIECSGSIDKVKLTSEKVGYVNWKFFNEPLTRFEWAVGETTGLLLGFIILVVIMSVIGWFIYLIKR